MLLRSFNPAMLILSRGRSIYNLRRIKMARILLQSIDDRGQAGVFLDRDTEFRVSVTDSRGTVAPATG